MDGLQLTCEFTFNKKENFAAAVFAVLYCPQSVLFSASCTGGRMGGGGRGRDAAALRNQITRLPVSSVVIGLLGVSMETSWKQELLLLATRVCVSLCVCRGGSWFVWLPFRKVALQKRLKKIKM